MVDNGDIFSVYTDAGSKFELTRNVSGFLNLTTLLGAVSFLSADTIFMQSGYSDDFDLSTTNTSIVSGSGSMSLATGTGTLFGTGDISITTGLISSTAVQPTGTVTVTTGDDAGSGGSGSIILDIGSSTGGTQGDVRFQDNGALVAAFEMETRRLDLSKDTATHLVLPVSTAGTPATGALRWTVANKLEYYEGSWTAAGGGSPGGADKQIQFNDGGAFGGDAGLTWTKATDRLTLLGDYYQPVTQASGYNFQIYTNDGGTTDYISIHHDGAGANRLDLTAVMYKVDLTADSNISLVSVNGYARLQGDNAGVQLTTNSETSIWSGPITLQTGNVTSSGNSGDINLAIGTAASVVGSVNFKASSTLLGAFEMETYRFDLRKRSDVAFVLPASTVGSTWLAGSLRYDGSDVQVYNGASWEDVVLPGGTDTQLQFNDNGAFGGAAGAVWDKTGKLLEIGGVITVKAAALGSFETLPDCCDGGITLFRDTISGGPSATLKSDGVNHNFTAVAEADTFAYFDIGSSGNGGLVTVGLCDSGAGTEPGLSFYACSYAPATDPAAEGAIAFRGYKSALASLADTENLFTLSNAGVNKTVIKGSGRMSFRTSGTPATIPAAAGIDLRGSSPTYNTLIIPNTIIADMTGGTGALRYDGADVAIYNGSAWLNLAFESEVAPTPPGGADTQVQFNDSGAFGGDQDFTWSDTTHTLTLGAATLSTLSLSGDYVQYITQTGGESFRIESDTPADYFQIDHQGAAIDRLDLTAVLYDVSFSTANDFTVISAAASLGLITLRADDNLTLDTNDRNSATVTGDVYVYTGNNAGSAASGQIVLQTGTAATAATGGGYFRSGNKTTASGGTGSINIYSGYINNASNTSTTGSFMLYSGQAIGPGNSGSVLISSGATDSGNSGNFNFTTGNADAGGDTGYIRLATGDSASGTSGDLRLAVGSGGGAQGNIEFQDDSITIAQFNMTNRNLELGVDVIITTGGETSPDVDPGGLCLDHNSGDANVLTFKNSDVIHPFTTIAEADTYAAFSKVDASEGGLLATGLAKVDGPGIILRGFTQSPTTGRTSGVVVVSGYKASGSSAVALADGEDLFAVANAASIKLLTKGNGDVYTGGKLFTTGWVSTAELSPDVDDGGLCLNHSARSGGPFPTIDFNAVTMKDSGFTHAMTAAVEPDTHGQLRKSTTANGGLTVRGISSGGAGPVTIEGFMTNPSSSIPCIRLDCFEDDGSLNVGELKSDTDLMLAVTNATAAAKLKLNVGGTLTIAGSLYAGGNEALADVSPGGVNSHLGSNTGASLCLQQDNINNPFTTTPGENADTYGKISMYYTGTSPAPYGGMNISGFVGTGSSAVIGLCLNGYAEDADTSESNTTSIGTVCVRAYKADESNGTTIFGTDDNIFVVANTNLARFIVKGNGDYYFDGTDQGPFDDEDDIALVAAARSEMSEDTTKIRPDDKQRLEELGVMKNGFISGKKMTALQLGAVGQLWNMIRHMAMQLGFSEGQLLEMAKNYA